MPYGMYISAEGAQAQAKRMETLSNNLANVDTPGFKRDVATFQARLTEAIQRGLDQAGSGSINDIGGGVMLAGIRTDHSPGALKHTGSPTDFAIVGDGFFVIQSDREAYLSRAGNFKMTAAGQLVTQNGLAVLNDSGAPILIDPELGPWQVADNGAITQAGATIHQLAVRTPASVDDLVKVGENLFRPRAATELVPLTERTVRQGYLEGSAVSPTLEMMALIETSRAFAANTKLIQHQDHMISTLISRVLGT
ncbi:MAG: flagellar basal-body rod protein FlgF [Planctomycetes bacterium RBG_16_64_10]|nr:MAG: flagellar basal-body rod protein FlgF [Planctomycetes bacterium RBG_16_64_10]